MIIIGTLPIITIVNVIINGSCYQTHYKRVRPQKNQDTSLSLENKMHYASIHYYI